MGRENSIWGNNWPGIVALVLMVVFAAVSLGLLGRRPGPQRRTGEHL